MMKYIITEKQYNLISEALGVPDNILDAAEEFYNIFLDKLKHINEKKNEYEFEGSVDIILGDKKKIKIDEYFLRIEVNEFDEFNEPPQVSSMGMGQTFMFDRQIFMKRIEPSTKAEFSITFVANPNWEVGELYNEFLTNKIDHISSIAHELKHKYDKQVKRVGLIGDEAEYIGIVNMGNFGIPFLDNKFKLYLYYTTAAENLVRATEVASNMKSKKIKKENFREFLENDRTFLMLVNLKNFTFEKLVDGISNSMNRVDEILRMIKIDPSEMSEDEKINKILELYYINLVNTKLEVFAQYVDSQSDFIHELLSNFGGSFSTTKPKIDDIKRQFQNHIIKYQNNPNQFFKDEIKNFHKVADQMIRKLSKLYASIEDNQATNESIINWELHMKLMDKKYGNKIKTKIDF